MILSFCPDVFAFVLLACQEVCLQIPLFNFKVKCLMIFFFVTREVSTHGWLRFGSDLRAFDRTSGVEVFANPSFAGAPVKWGMLIEVCLRHTLVQAMYVAPEVSTKLGTVLGFLRVIPSFFRLRCCKSMSKVEMPSPVWIHAFLVPNASSEQCCKMRIMNYEHVWTAKHIWDGVGLHSVKKG